MQLKSFILSLVLILSLIPQGVLANTNDTTPPTLESIEMIDTTVRAGEKVSFKVKAKDDLSGISKIAVSFTSPSGKHIVFADLGSIEETENHMYTLTTHAINSFAEAGIWYISSISIKDNAGNQFYQSYKYNPFNPHQKEPIVTFKVKNDSGDRTPPTLESIEMIDTNVSPGEKVSFKVKAKDDLSGISNITASFTSPSGRSIGFANLKNIEETENHMYTLTINGPSFLDTGTWYISNLSIEDNAGNKFNKYYGYVSSLDAPIVTFEVKNESLDPKPPTFESIEMIDTNVSPGEQVSFKVKVKDDLSGVSTIIVGFNSPSGTQYVSATLNIEQETEDHIYTLTTNAIETLAEEGIWYISNVFIKDKSGRTLESAYGSYQKFANFEVKDDSIDPKPPTSLIPNEDDFKTWDSKYNVPLNKEWTVDFNLAFDIKTILSDNIYITDASGKKVPLLFVVDRGADNQSSTLIIAPVDNYVTNTTYTLWIKDIYSEDGKKLSENVKMQFTTK